MTIPRSTTIPLPTIALALFVLLAGVTAAAVLATAADGSPVEPTAEPVGETTVENALYTDATNATPDEPIEERYEDPVPERGDPDFEAEATDGSWISYMNPRDYYREPYLGDGSGKICVTMVNEHGEVVVGESVPETTVTIPTGESLEWHPHADPFTVEYPLTDNYDTPLDADQFGTSDLPQGDGYMDSHCLEFHGLPEDGEIEYGEVEIEGEYADWIDVVGYIHVENEAWDTDVDPIEDAAPYEELGGGWEYHHDGSHGQAVVVLQLDPPDDAYDDLEGGEGSGDGSDGTDDETGDTDDGSDDGSGTDDADGADDGSSSDSSDDADELPGFGALAATIGLATVTVVALLASRRE